MSPIDTLINVLQEELARVTGILGDTKLAVNIKHRASLSMYRVQLAEKIYMHSLPKMRDSDESLMTDLGGPKLDDPSSATSARS